MSPGRQQAGLGLNAARKSWVGISTKEETEARVEKRKRRPRSTGRDTPSASGQEGNLQSPGDHSLGAGLEMSPGLWSLFARSWGRTDGSGPGCVGGDDVR